MVPAIVRNAARDQLESLPAIVGIRIPTFDLGGGGLCTDNGILLPSEY
jgi:hypothetical protein